MDEFAEKGVASHFAYKEKHYMQNVMEQRLESLRNLIESSDSLSDIEFANNIEQEFVNESIYVFTPKGDVLELPKGATPLDFAYRIHSDVGDKTVQAIVNDTSVPLNYELQNNDIVKIRTSSTGTPSKEWLNFVKTSHAKNKIKSYFSKQDKENYTEKGKNILTSEIRKRKLSIDQVLSMDNVKKICEDLKLETLEDIYFSIGTLRYTASYIINLTTEDKKNVEDILLEKVMSSNSRTKPKASKGEILVDNQEGILVNLAKCCHPVFGDEIVGYITKGEGVTVHKKNCVNVRDKEERFIKVEWNNDITSNFETDVVITTNSGKNYLLDIISKATTKKVYVDGVKTKSDNLDTIYTITVKVTNKEQLEDFMNSLYAYKFVKRVERK